MTDRELLELAAKAAGVSAHWSTDGTIQARPLFVVSVSGSMGAMPYEEEWNPLKNDGDALRLAVKLKIRIGFRPAAYADTPNGLRFYGAHNGDNADSRTRFAIVRAAAEIWRTLQAAKATGCEDSGRGSQKGTP